MTAMFVDSPLHFDLKVLGTSVRSKGRTCRLARTLWCFSPVTNESVTDVRLVIGHWSAPLTDRCTPNDGI